MSILNWHNRIGIYTLLEKPSKNDEMSFDIFTISYLKLDSSVVTLCTKTMAKRKFKVAIF